MFARLEGQWDVYAHDTSLVLSPASWESSAGSSNRTVVVTQLLEWEMGPWQGSYGPKVRQR